VFNLNDVLASLGSLYEKTENFDLSLNLLPHRIYVMADKTQLNRLFTNLLQNAVEACSKQENPEVIINEVIEEDKVVITVKDNGEGIPADTRAKIFIPNFTTKSSGTGLGLAMSKSIAEHARGKIWFETAEGAGTTFFVELPVVRMVD
jgi:signal transduction histidine kinase